MPSCSLVSKVFIKLDANLIKSSVAQSLSFVFFVCSQVVPEDVAKMIPKRESK